MKLEIDIFTDDYTIEDFRQDIINKVAQLAYQDLKSNLKDDTDIINTLIDKKLSAILKNDVRNMVQKQVNDKVSDIYSYIDRTKSV